MAKQIVFIVNTGAEGLGEGLGACKQRGPLDGVVREIQYIPDNRVPYDAGVKFEFSGAKSGVSVLVAEGVDGRETWNIEGGPNLDKEPIKVVVTGGGQGRSGSFKVTCS